jgi:hypothetical protein
MTRSLLLPLLPLLLTGCFERLGGVFGGDLSERDVTDLPEGDASGSKWTGQYNVEIYTVACDGECGPISFGYYTVSMCDVGDTDSEWLEVDQSDGALDLELDDPISRYQGGVYSDDSFEAGGYGTDYGGDIEMAALLEGTFTIQGLTATATSHIWGDTEIDGESVHIDCTGEYEVDGQRFDR